MAIDDAEILAFEVPTGDSTRLDVWLVERLPDFSRARVQGLFVAVFVTVNGTPPPKAGMKLKGGERIEVSIPPPVPAIPEPEDIPLSVLFEDDDLLALDKPAGLVVHPAPGHLNGTLVNALLHHCPNLSGIGGVARPGIVHRLDQDTSGVMVVAKSQRAMDSLVKQFASHTALRKTYLAVVHGVPAPCFGRIENLIGRSAIDRKKMAIVQKNGKNAITNYRTLATLDKLSLVECRIETGRTHQIRVHMASLGSPIAGDKVYGHPGWDRNLNPQPQRQLLHAWKLELRHPATHAPMVFTAPVPPDFPAGLLASDMAPGEVPAQ